MNKKILSIIILGTILFAGCNSKNVSPVPTPNQNLNSSTATNGSIKIEEKASNKEQINGSITINPATDTSNTSPISKDPELKEDNTAESAAGQYNIYLISVDAKEENTKTIGCGDSLIPVTLNSDSKAGAQPAEILVEAYNKLFSLKTENYGESGFTNTLYQSNLSVDSISVNKGKAIVKLKGKLVLGGECDNPRAESQLTEIAKQLPEVTSAEIYLNGEKLDKFFSLK